MAFTTPCPLKPAVARAKEGRVPSSPRLQPHAPPHRIHHIRHRYRPVPIEVRRHYLFPRQNLQPHHRRFGDTMPARAR